MLGEISHKVRFLPLKQLMTVLAPLTRKAELPQVLPFDEVEHPVCSIFSNNVMTYALGFSILAWVRLGQKLGIF